MQTLLANLGMLCGILLAAAGVLAVLVTGFDPLWGGAGLAVGIVGGALAYFSRKHAGIETSASGAERSRQLPEQNTKSTGKSKTSMGRKL